MSSESVLPVSASGPATGKADPDIQSGSNTEQCSNSEPEPAPLPQAIVSQEAENRDETRPTQAIPPKTRHDLRNYIGQVIGYSDLWLDAEQAEYDSALREDLQRIHEAGKQLLGIVNSHVDPVYDHNELISPIAVENHDSSVTQTRLMPETSTVSSTVRSQLAHWRSPAPILTLQKTEPVSNLSALNRTTSVDFATDTGHILVVDDNAVNRELLRRRLEQQGHQIATAADGNEAIEQMRERPYDVLLLDILMPGLNGYEVLRQLKADENLRHIPVIMISALDDMSSIIRCIEMGADDYLPKPFDPVLLKARIGASLEKKRLRDRERSLFNQVQDNYQRLQELESLRDDLTYMIVHDLRTPLTSLLSGLQSIGISDHLDADERELLDIAESGGRTLLGMINDLLDVSKMESGTLTLDYSLHAPRTLLENAVRQVEALVEQKNLTLITEIEAGLPLFSCDEEKLVRVLVNLLGNAVKFTPPDGKITVAVRWAEDGDLQSEAGLKCRNSPCMLFSVRDTGEGIPSEAFERIFQKFGQVDTRKSGRKMSTGLGLTFCKMAVEAHGGQIRVESELGHGSAFIFLIPTVIPV